MQKHVAALIATHDGNTKYWLFRILQSYETFISIDYTLVFCIIWSRNLALFFLVVHGDAFRMTSNILSTY